MILHRDVKITMYQLGHRSRHHYIRVAIVTLLLVGIVTAGIVVVRQFLRPNTVLVQSNPITENVPVSSTQMQHIMKASVAFDVPVSWHERTTDGSMTPQPLTSWQGTVKDDQARWIDVYIDTVPTNLAANRLLPVEADGDRMTVTDTTSDNCVNFTDKSAGSSHSGMAPAKWSGVNFLCDTANYERDVVVTGSNEGVNTIILDSPLKGKHRVLLVYTDNSPNPDYTLFATIVKSFRVL